MSSRGRLENVLTSRINLTGTPLERQIRASLDVISRRPQDVRLRRPLNVRSGRPRDGQIGSLGDVPVSLEWDILGTSWGPIFAVWDITNFKPSNS